MPADQPPPYDVATHQPQVNVTDPSGGTSPAVEQRGEQQKLHRAASSDTLSSISTDGGLAHLSNGLVDEEGRRSMDDEMRELPEGWIRCFDPKSEHHFYVDEKTKRSSWLHPYDDPEFLRTLPDTHPANPKSIQAQAIRKHAEDEALMLQKMKDAREVDRKGGGKAELDRKANGKYINDDKLPGGPGSSAAGHEQSSGNGTTNGATDHHDEHRNFFQRQKDKLIGTKEEREQAKAEKARVKAEQQKRMREAEEAYLKRRRELAQKQLNDPDTQRMYASDPYAYSAPATSYSRAGGLYDSPYGYGYGGGYGRRYGGGYPGYGYGGMGYGGMGGMGGMGLGLGGGLLGGILIGDMMGGGMGGGFGGGGFGGGFDGGMMGGGMMGGGMGGGGFGC